MPPGELRFGLGDLFFQLPIDFSLRREQRPGKRRDGAIQSDPVEKLFDPADTLRGYVPELGCVSRMEFATCVRTWIRRLRTPISINADCCCGVFIGTNLIVGRLNASQMASASAASFFPRFT